MMARKENGRRKNFHRTCAPCADSSLIVVAVRTATISAKRVFVSLTSFLRSERARNTIRANLLYLPRYMAYMKQGIAKYKEENPGVAHKEAFSRVRSLFCLMNASSSRRWHCDATRCNVPDARAGRVFVWPCRSNNACAYFAVISLFGNLSTAFLNYSSHSLYLF